MSEARIHPETGKVLHLGVQQQTVTVGSTSRTVAVVGWYPDDDGDSTHAGADLAESERVFAELRADPALGR